MGLLDVVSSNGSIQHTAVVNAPGSCLSLATRLMHPRFANEDPYGSASPPLYQTATFRQVSAVECGPYDYTRSGNPTRSQLEDQMAEVEVRALQQCLYMHKKSECALRVSWCSWLSRQPYTLKVSGSSPGEII